MPPKVAVVELLSRCDRCGSESRALPFCACGALKDLPGGVSHFAVLGFPESWRLDENTLRERFYELSKKTHPDRYGQAAPQDAMHALRWSTAVNRAYQTLREPEKRARYLLELKGKADKKDAIPFDLAETYFEIQDSEDPKVLDAFKNDMTALLAETETNWDAVADDMDKLGAHLVKLKYLRSMIADIERKQGVGSEDSRH